MYAAIRFYKVKPGSADVITQSAQDGFVPLISSVPGFIAYYGVFGEHDTVVTVSVFADQGSAEESTRQAAGWVKQNLAQYVEGPPEIVAGQVAWHAAK